MALVEPCSEAAWRCPYATRECREVISPPAVARVAWGLRRVSRAWRHTCCEDVPTQLVVARAMPPRMACTFPLTRPRERSLTLAHARKEVVQWTVATNPARWLTLRSVRSVVNRPFNWIASDRTGSVPGRRRPLGPRPGESQQLDRPRRVANPPGFFFCGLYAPSGCRRAACGRSGRASRRARAKAQDADERRSSWTPGHVRRRGSIDALRDPARAVS